VTGAIVATVGHGSTALWYLTRSTGLVALVLLSATVVLGIVSSVGWTSERWPRFLSQSVHRNLSLFCLVLIGVHVVSTVGDGYVPINLADAVFPFRTPYRPLWVGLGALAFDMLLAVAITSALRHRIGVRAWRGVHWLAYACWPIALAHGLGSGSDPRLPLATAIFVVCTGAVAAAVIWRLAIGPARSRTRRWVAAGGVTAILAALAIFAANGPLKPGWSHRAGTSPALLAQLATGAPATYVSKATAGTTAPSRPSAGLPAVPFTSSVSGTVTSSSPDANGEVHVDLHMTLAGSGRALDVQIIGPAEDGGVSLRTSQVSFAGLTGRVTTLDGSIVEAVVSGPSGSVDLTLNLSLDPRAGTLSGQVAGSAA
jgi:Ferric reductase like transmembrane component